MNRPIAITIISLMLLIFGACKKNESPTWTFCTNCTLDEWTGSYSGEGDYYNGTADKTELNIPTLVVIENLSGNVLKTTITAEDRLSTSFISTKDDNNHYYSIAGSGKSMDLSLSIKGSEFKLSGTVKLYHINKDTVVIDQSISFDTYR